MQAILESVHHIPYCKAWLEEEITRVSSGKPVIGAEPRPGPAQPTLPWERPSDSSDMRAVLVLEEQLGAGRVKSMMKIYLPAMSQPAGQPRPQTSRCVLSSIVFHRRWTRSEHCAQRVAIRVRRRHVAQPTA